MDHDSAQSEVMNDLVERLRGYCHGVHDDRVPKDHPYRYPQPIGCDDIVNDVHEAATAIEALVPQSITPADEPVFLLRAKDKLAPDLVRRWANALGEAGGDVHLQQRVLEWADEMEAYAAEHYDGGKVPDTPQEFLR